MLPCPDMELSPARLFGTKHTKHAAGNGHWRESLALLTGPYVCHLHHLPSASLTNTKFPFRQHADNPNAECHSNTSNTFGSNHDNTYDEALVIDSPPKHSEPVSVRFQQAPDGNLNISPYGVTSRRQRQPKEHNDGLGDHNGGKN